MTFNPMSLEGRTILVTGATSGIGKATAIYLSKLGARVVASGRNSARLDETLAALEGTDHIGRLFDLADLDAIVPWLKALCAEIGPLNGIAHCAGVQATRPIQAVKPDFVMDVLTQNLGAALMLAQAFRLKSCHGSPASLVYCSSSAALKTAPGNVVYAASKGGIVSAVKGLGVELVRDGVRVNAVAPAMVDTPMSDQFRTILSEENFQRVVDMHPLGLGRPDDVAAAIAFLLADTSRWITGSILSVDGGFLA
ncbi:SDR family NAD(P)-dependent oxidoreductase [Asticcacaulis taihuensis]|uniref:D-xylose 1-dehydrogenase n=1 Tax=Asticcacaulis taihuensis TaxID=260084 RepID=A0A1G4RKF2_9CAUL|nr:SDR family oxidoreductase [Asticcacaulis taihuensis]SCW57308.1 NAD(P)-dependent dehydrogenase, short-chain alcohol dehydrogenase family [Asticcacaulis taihuensis]